LNLRAGHFKLPGSREFSVLSYGTDFVERSMIATRLVPARDWGVTAGGTLGRVEYQLGAFRGDGSTSIRRSGTSGVLRLSADLGSGFQLSGSFLQGQVSADPIGGGEAPLPKGAWGATATGYAFSSRPYVEGARRRLSSSLSFSRGAFRFLGEYLEEREERRGQGLDREDLPDALGRGWSAQAAYLIGGQRRGALTEPGTSIFQGGAGAIELAARAEMMVFDDTGGSSASAGSANRSADLATAGVTAIEAGVNYWTARFMKLQATALWETYNDPLVAPNPGNRGPYFSVIARVQFMIP
jgi:phosphate-selective porin OprO and OprP